MYPIAQKKQHQSNSTSIKTTPIMIPGICSKRFRRVRSSRNRRDAQLHFGCPVCMHEAHRGVHQHRPGHCRRRGGACAFVYACSHVMHWDRPCVFVCFLGLFERMYFICVCVCMYVCMYVCIIVLYMYTLYECIFVPHGMYACKGMCTCCMYA